MLDSEEFLQLHQWWRKYGRWLVLAGVLVVIGVIVWQTWVYHKTKQDEKAASIYYRVEIALKNHAPTQLQNNVDTLIQRYPTTPYAALGQLILAKIAVENNKLRRAAGLLDWVVHHGSQPALRRLAVLRLAKIRITQNKPDEALALLRSPFSEVYLPLVNNLVGDAWLAKNGQKKAHAAFAQAVAAAQAQGLPTGILELKLTGMDSSVKELQK